MTLFGEDGDETADAGNLISVLLPLPLGPYTYRIPPEKSAPLGAYIEVPLGPRRVLGVVWDDVEDSDVDLKKVKDIYTVLDFPPMSEAMRKFLTFMSGYNFRPLGNILALTMRSRGALEPPRMKKLVSPTGETVSPLTPARKRVFEAAEDGFARTPADLADVAGVSSSVVKGLVEKGAFETIEVPQDAPYDSPDPDYQTVDLSEGQRLAADRLRDCTEDQEFETLLLDGVTGSGKTEVYFEAIAEALRQKKQALVLLPEIALTHQILKRFEKRFGVMPAAWHSGMTGPERRRAYRGIATGEARVVIGARSALFLPFTDLGLIIVDEEHDSSFKQEDGIVYHARDMAVARASIGGFPVVLASATPSLETVANVETGKYERLQLTSRHGAPACQTLTPSTCVGYRSAQKSFCLRICAKPFIRPLMLVSRLFFISIDVAMRRLRFVEPAVIE